MKIEEIATKADLDNLKSDILEMLRQDFNSRQKPAEIWLRNKQVLEMLGISQGALQNLRIKGDMPFTKVGAVLYYKLQDIHNLLNKNYTGPKN